MYIICIILHRKIHEWTVSKKDVETNSYGFRNYIKW